MAMQVCIAIRVYPAPAAEAISLNEKLAFVSKPDTRNNPSAIEDLNVLNEHRTLNIEHRTLNIEHRIRNSVNL